MDITLRNCENTTDALEVVEATKAAELEAGKQQKFIKNGKMYLARATVKGVTVEDRGEVRAAQAAPISLDSAHKVEEVAEETETATESIFPQ